LFLFLFFFNCPNSPSSYTWYTYLLHTTKLDLVTHKTVAQRGTEPPSIQT
jgi:hypothetical protein